MRTSGYAALAASLIMAAATIPMTALAVELTNPAARTYAVGRDGVTDWRGYIINKRGRVFKADETRTDEASAKLVAKGECERKGGFTCDVGKAIAIADDPDWTLVAVSCSARGRTGYYLGASAIDRGGALWKALDKASHDGFAAVSCSEITLAGNE